MERGLRVEGNREGEKGQGQKQVNLCTCTDSL